MSEKRLDTGWTCTQNLVKYYNPPCFEILTLLLMILIVSVFFNVLLLCSVKGDTGNFVGDNGYINQQASPPITAV